MHCSVLVGCIIAYCHIRLVAVKQECRIVELIVDYAPVTTYSIYMGICITIIMPPHDPTLYLVNFVFLDICSYFQSRCGLYIFIYLIQGKPRSEARTSTLVAVKVWQHLTKCMDCHQINTLIIPIKFTISSHYLKKVQINCILLYLSVCSLQPNKENLRSPNDSLLAWIWLCWYQHLNNI